MASPLVFLVRIRSPRRVFGPGNVRLPFRGRDQDRKRAGVAAGPPWRRVGNLIGRPLARESETVTKSIRRTQGRGLDRRPIDIQPAKPPDVREQVFDLASRRKFPPIWQHISPARTRPATESVTTVNQPD